MLVAPLHICLLNLCTLKANHVCHKSLSVMSMIRNAAVFFFSFFSRMQHFRQHFALGLPHTIRSAPKSPHIFHPFTSLPIPVSLLLDHSSSAAQSCPISVSPSPRLFILLPLFSLIFLTCHSADCCHLCHEGEEEGYWNC